MYHSASDIRMATLPLQLVLLLTLTLLAACTAPASRVRIDQAEGGLPNCRSFAWHSISGDAASLTDQRVKAAVMAQLKTKGYAESADQPACRIAYQLTRREIPKSKPGVGVGVGGGSGGVGGGVGITLPIGRKAGYTGTFTLDVIDAVKNAQVWSGTVDAELAAPEISDSEAQELAGEVLGAFPNAQ